MHVFLNYSIFLCMQNIWKTNRFVLFDTNCWLWIVMILQSLLCFRYRIQTIRRSTKPVVHCVRMFIIHVVQFFMQKQFNLSFFCSWLCRKSFEKCWRKSCKFHRFTQFTASSRQTHKTNVLLFSVLFFVLKIPNSIHFLSLSIFLSPLKCLLSWNIACVFSKSRISWNRPAKWAVCIWLVCSIVELF